MVNDPAELWGYKQDRHTANQRRLAKIQRYLERIAAVCFRLGTQVHKA